jgi:hypothetical protein
MTFAKPGQKYLVDWSNETDDPSDRDFRPQTLHEEVLGYDSGV